MVEQQALTAPHPPRLDQGHMEPAVPTRHGIQCEAGCAACPLGHGRSPHCPLQPAEDGIGPHQQPVPGASPHPSPGPGGQLLLSAKCCGHGAIYLAARLPPSPLQEKLHFTPPSASPPPPSCEGSGSGSEDADDPARALAPRQGASAGAPPRAQPARSADLIGLPCVGSFQPLSFC